MSVARRPLPVPLPHRRRARPEGGFTLLELVCAFALLAVVLSFMAQVEGGAIARANKAIETRDVAVMADTVFRRIVYEVDKHNEGESQTADEMYGRYIGLEGLQKDRWKDYRLLVHKRRGMVVGADPTGKLESLFDAGQATEGTTGSSSSSGSGSSSSSSEEPTGGEEAYLVTLEVYFLDQPEPLSKISSVVPIPPSEEDSR